MIFLSNKESIYNNEPVEGPSKVNNLLLEQLTFVVTGIFGSLCSLTIHSSTIIHSIYFLPVYYDYIVNMSYDFWASYDI